MALTYKLDKPGKRVILENGNTRYIFYTTPIYKGPIDHREIDYYKPTIERSICYTLGSSLSWDYPAAEIGNKQFKELLSQGFKIVEKPSWA